VDDERAARRPLTELFGRLGYRAAEAASGQKALECLARQCFDLVILDLKMPGMDGTEVLEKAHSLAPDTVFIILTAYGTLTSAIAGVRHGAFDYLLKPSPVQEIIRAVEAGLAERQRRLYHENPVAVLERALTGFKATAQQPEAAPAPRRFLQTPDITVDTLKRLVVVRLVAHVRGCDLAERDAGLLLRSHICRLRQKLERDPARPRLLFTVRGSGYILTG
jgi:DNA-binding response OmpR family regulator